MLSSGEWKRHDGAAKIEPRVVSYACSVASDDSTCRKEWATEYQFVSSVCDDGEWIEPQREIIRLLVESFRQIPEVASICAQFSPEGIAIWTLLKEYDRDAREAVYVKELELCEYLGGCDFDFRVSSIDLVTPGELVESGSREIFKRS
jgi:hypothetical protein